MCPALGRNRFDSCEVLLKPGGENMAMTKAEATKIVDKIEIIKTDIADSIDEIQDLIEEAVEDTEKSKAEK